MNDQVHAHAQTQQKSGWDKLVEWLDLKRLISMLVAAVLLGGFSTFSALQSSSIANAGSVNRLESDLTSLRGDLKQHEVIERTERGSLRTELRDEATRTRSEILDEIRDLRKDVREGSP